MLEALPQAVSRWLQGYEAEPVTVGMSGAGVYRWRKAGKPGLI